MELLSFAVLRYMQDTHCMHEEDQSDLAQSSGIYPSFCILGTTLSTLFFLR